MAFFLCDPDDIAGLPTSDNENKPIETVAKQNDKMEVDMYELSAKQVEDFFKSFENNDDELSTTPPRPQSNNRTESRFRKMTEDQLRNLEENRQAKSTKRNTKWGIKAIQEWNSQSGFEEINFKEIEAESLNEKLRKFYAELTPKKQEIREKQMSQDQAKEYHKNTMKNIRAAINRHLKDLGRSFDIVKDREFRTSNNMLDGLLKHNMQTGLSRPTQHKPIINNEDLSKIDTYLHSAFNPIILRWRVWFNISIHFVSRGLEFHNQLTPKSFVFKNDENGMEYVSLSHETKEKNHQGGLKSEESSVDKRMYAINCDTDRCPVIALKALLSKTDPTATQLFNHCEKESVKNPNSPIWYTSTPVKPYQFSTFMPDISKNAGCSVRYTAHSLRATSIQKLNDAGFELRHIMYMTGHRNESSIRSYNRECSTAQKRNISHTLTQAVNPKSISDAQVQQSTMAVRSPVIRPSPVLQPRFTFNPLPANTNSFSSNVMSSGLISNSSFANCTFNFTK